MAYRIENKVWLTFTIYRKGRFRFYHFDDYLEDGIQFYPYATVNELSRSWRITSKLLKTRARPKARFGLHEGKEGIFVYRQPRIHGEEYLIKLLDATKFMSEKVTYL
jgi:hypothetical protein